MSDVEVSHELRAEFDPVELHPAHSHIRFVRPHQDGSGVHVQDPRVAGDDAVTDAQRLRAIRGNQFRELSLQLGVVHDVAIPLRRLLRGGLRLAIRESRDGSDVGSALFFNIRLSGCRRLFLFFLLPRVVERRRGTGANLFLDLFVPPVPDRHPVQLQRGALHSEKREREPPRLAQRRADDQPVSFVERVVLVQADVLEPRSVPVSFKPVPVYGRVEVLGEVPPPSRGGRRAAVNAAGERTEERRAPESTQRAAGDAVPLRPARQPVHLPDRAGSDGTQSLRGEIRGARSLGVRGRGVQPRAHANWRRRLERGFPARPRFVTAGLPRAPEALPEGRGERVGALEVALGLPPRARRCPRRPRPLGLPDSIPWFLRSRLREHPKSVQGPECILVVLQPRPFRVIRREEFLVAPFLTPRRRRRGRTERLRGRP